MRMNKQQGVQLAAFLRGQSLISDETFNSAKLLSDESGKNIIDVLLEREFVTEQGICAAVSQAFGLPQVNLDSESSVDLEVLHLVPRRFLLANRLMPFKREGTRLHVALAEPANLDKVAQLKLITDFDIEAHVTPLKSLQSWLEYVSLNEDGTHSIVEGVTESMHVDIEEDEEAEFEEQAGSSEVILFVNEVISLAIERGVSDIHIEPYKKKARMRFRLDGVLYDQKERNAFLREHYSAVITRIKIMSKLDIAERRLPQDGAITFKTVKGREVDLRVSVLPANAGERVVMRLLDHSSMGLHLDNLGFGEHADRVLRSSIAASQGMVLVTGPTGSGKSTTLYACLNEINQDGINILTAEDPVEYVMEGIGQVQIKEHIGLTFSSVLRSFLRQDPEVILVGEIRDKETADIAIKASLTGHLVLSTLHTNDAVSTVTRLVNMGVEPYLVVAALTLVVGQRLARKNCSHCVAEDTVRPEQLRLIGLTPAEMSQIVTYRGKGCQACNGTGYKGRQGIYEVLEITPRLKHAILAGQDTDELLAIAIEEGFQTLQRVGLDYVKQGLLSVEEYQRVLLF